MNSTIIKAKPEEVKFEKMTVATMYKYTDTVDNTTGIVLCVGDSNGDRRLIELSGDDTNLVWGEDTDFDNFIFVPFNDSISLANT